LPLAFPLHTGGRLGKFSHADNYPEWRRSLLPFAAPTSGSVKTYPIFAIIEDKPCLVVGGGDIAARKVEALLRAGAKVTVADVYPPAIEQITEAFEVDIVSPDEIVDVECDIFAPCSMGAVFDEPTISRLRCRAIVGAANNQLCTSEDAERIAERDILYAPDFVVNAGGLINVSEELRGYTVEKAAAHIDKVYDNTLRVLEASRERAVTPNVAAVDLAQERINEIGNLRLFRRSGDDRN